MNRREKGNKKISKLDSIKTRRSNINANNFSTVGIYVSQAFPLALILVCLFLSQFACFVSSYCILLFLGCLFLIRDRKAVEPDGRENEEDLGGVGGAETIIITI